MLIADNLSLRQAALTLHALSQDDRRRVWSRLAPDKRSALEPLLAELRDLGIPAGRAWVDVDAVSNEAETQPELDRLVSRTRRLRVEVILKVLSLQSLDTAACVLAWASWPWRDAVLSNWSPESRLSLSQRVQERSLAPSNPFVMAMLLGSLLRAAQAPVPAQPAQVGKWGAWFNRLLQR